MVYLSDDVKDSIRSLCYYPYTIGKHLDKITQTLNNIYNAFIHLPDSIKLFKRVVPNVGSIWYFTRNGNIYIEKVSWSSTLTKFYYVKSNFITFTAQRNISSVHPSQYVVRDEPYFRCDNGFKVVSRNYRGKQLFNFIDVTDGFARIISDIDFIQVKPFSEHKDMTARGYTPDRRCYMVFQDGTLEELNENILMRKNKNSLMEQNNKNTTNTIMSKKLSIKEILSNYTRVILNNLNSNYRKFGELTLDRNQINDMGFWFDEIQPLIYDISEKYGISFEQAKSIYEKAWNNAFDSFENNKNNQINCNVMKSKNKIRLSESQLKQMIKETVKSILRESEEHIYGIEMYTFDGNGFTQSTDWDWATENFLQGEAIEQAEYYLQYSNDSDTVIRVYNKKTGETVKLFT